MLYSPTQDHLLFLRLAEQSSQQQLLSLQCKENSTDLELHIPPVFIFSFLVGQLVLKDISLCSFCFWKKLTCSSASGISHLVVYGSPEQRFCNSSKQQTSLLLKSKPLNSSFFDLHVEASFFHYSLYKSYAFTYTGRRLFQGWHFLPCWSELDPTGCL